jgi:hypothetical protein
MRLKNEKARCASGVSGPDLVVSLPYPLSSADTTAP